MHTAHSSHAAASYSQAQARKQLLEARARFMRFNPTSTEALLFSAIRGKRLGVAFRRQQVIGSHIVDFLARQAKLVIEVDGDALHARQSSADAARDRKLVRAGYTVLRIPASLVQDNLPRAVRLVYQALVKVAAR